MHTMVALTLKSYNGKPLKPGQRFEVEDGHVRTLVVTRKAEMAKAEAEEESGGRRYKRRDMTAQ